MALKSGRLCQALLCDPFAQERIGGERAWSAEQWIGEAEQFGVRVE
jgi:hypothetical protein